jgi:RHH-type rel operon transcriptional repressor/antitoxin RelB
MAQARRGAYEILVSPAQEDLPMGAVSLRLPDEVSRRLQQLADRTGRSKTFYMIEAIQEHLDDLEDLYLAEQRLIDLRAGESETVPLDELMKRYGMDGRA